MQLYETRLSESALQTEIQFLRQASETREKKLQDDIRRLQAELASHMRRSENGGLAGESPQYAGGTLARPDTYIWDNSIPSSFPPKHSFGLGVEVDSIRLGVKRPMF